MEEFNPREYVVKGFMAQGMACGIKKDGRKDLAVIYSQRPAVADGVFTTNAFQAAPVLLSREAVGSGILQAIVVNSGNANAATGPEGYVHARTVGATAASLMNLEEKRVAVCSTGVIGVPLPADKIVMALPQAVKGLSPTGLVDAEEAIMTTDRFPKMAKTKVALRGGEATICGLAKGAGMIAPNMATLLAFILTDAACDRLLLSRIFRSLVDTTFNAVTVDGCMSTNDTLLIMANGEAGNQQIDRMDRQAIKFRDALESVMAELACALVRDGEGATKVIKVQIRGAKTRKDAQRLARAVADSNLVKTAFYGGDPNWGRIVSAIGSIGIPLVTEKVKVSFDGVTIFQNGRGITENEDMLARIMGQENITVDIDIAAGRQSCTLLTSDLTLDYVRINSHYRT